MGFPEIDVLVDLDTDEVYLGELNPSISGASSMTKVTAGVYADVPGPSRAGTLTCTSVTRALTFPAIATPLTMVVPRPRAHRPCSLPEPERDERITCPWRHPPPAKLARPGPLSLVLSGQAAETADVCTDGRNHHDHP
jgi:hypothetical protein